MKNKIQIIGALFIILVTFVIIFATIDKDEEEPILDAIESEEYVVTSFPRTDIVEVIYTTPKDGDYETSVYDRTDFGWELQNSTLELDSSVINISCGLLPIFLLFTLSLLVFSCLSHSLLQLPSNPSSPSPFSASPPSPLLIASLPTFLQILPLYYCLSSLTLLCPSLLVPSLMVA